MRILVVEDDSLLGDAIQAADAILDGVARGEDQHRQRVAARAQLAQHLEARQTGQP